MLSSMVGIDERVTFFRELATLVDSGVSLGEALGILETRPAGPHLRMATRDAAKRVSSGERLSEVVLDHPRVFSSLNRAMIAAGEQSGRLDEVLLEVADYLEKEHELRQMISRETFYPKVLVAAVIIIPLAARTFIVWFQEGTGAAFAAALQTLGGYLLLFLALAALWFAYSKYRETSQGRYSIDRTKLSVPLLGPIISQLAWSRICRAIAALYKAGVSTARALELAGPASGNMALQQSLQGAIPHVGKGLPLSQALTESGYVPDLPLRMLRTGEETGDLDVTLEKVADYFEAQSRTSIHRLTLLIVPVATVIIGIVVLIMAMGAYVGYFDAIFQQ